IIHVTHDFNEAYSLADTLTIINSGKIEQTGPPAEVFRNPASRFVSALTGIRNFFTCLESKRVENLYCIRIKDGIHLYSSEPCSPVASVIIREDEIAFLPKDGSVDNNVFDGEITDIIPSPEFFSVVVNAGINFFARVTNEEMKNLNLHTGDSVRIKIPLGSVIPV
ncbi:MAG TPA: hypothetical protein PKN48_06165, partial [Bacteroidales bacterium]|nr:hypothetical protein [Bacteroidales bacterium]